MQLSRGSTTKVETFSQFTGNPSLEMSIKRGAV